MFDLHGQGGCSAGGTGLLEITELPADMGRFRASSLRDVAVTAPYAHDALDDPSVLARSLPS